MPFISSVTLDTSTNAVPPSPLTVSILGPPQIDLGKKQLPIRGNKSQALLVYLSLAHHSVSRTNLLEWIWPEEETECAGQSLNSLVSELNKIGRKLVTRFNLICHEQGYYRLNREAGIHTDIELFDQWRTQGMRLLQSSLESMALNRPIDQQTLERGLTYCEQAQNLYRGELGGDSSTRVLIERERLRIALLDILTAVANYYYAQGDLKNSLKYLYRLLAYEPCDEATHRQVMRCHMRMKQRSQALRQYRICTQTLASEFDITPEPETVELFENIRLNRLNIPFHGVL